MNTAAQRGLMGHALLGGLKRHIGDGVRCVRAIDLGSADGQVLEVGVTGEEARGILGNGPCPLGILQPQALNILQCGIVVDLAGLQVRLVVGIHILIEAAGVPCQRVLGKDAAQLDEPHKLNCLAEALGRVGGNGRTDLRDFLQLSLSLGVSFHGGHLSRLFGIAAAQRHHAIGNHDDGLVEIDLLFLLGNCLVELAQVLLGLFLDTRIALGQKNVNIIGRNLADAVSPLGVGVQEPGINADLLRCLGSTCKEGFLNGLALPVGENVLPNELGLLGRYLIGVLTALREGVNLIVDPQPAELRRQNCALAVLTACADNELALPNVDGQLTAGILKCLCDTDNVRKSFGSLEGFCPTPCSFVRNMRLCVDIVLADFFYSFGNSHITSSFPKLQCNLIF